MRTVVTVLLTLLCCVCALRVRETVFSNNGHTLQKSRVHSVLDVPPTNHVMYNVKLNPALEGKIVTLDDPQVYSVSCSDDLSSIAIGFGGVGKFDLEDGDVVTSALWCINSEAQTILTARRVTKVVHEGSVVTATTIPVQTASLFEDLDLSFHHAVNPNTLHQTAGSDSPYTSNAKTAEQLFEEMQDEMTADQTVGDLVDDLVDGEFDPESKLNLKKAFKKIGDTVKKVGGAIGDAWTKVKGVVGKIAEALKGDINFSKTLTFAKFTWNKEKKPLTLWSKGEMKLECASCIFNFQGVSVSASVKVKTFKLQDGTGITFKSGANANFKFQFKFDKHAEKTFSKELVTVFQTVITVPIGPIPVPVTVKVPIVAGFRLMLDADFVATATITAGFTITVGTMRTGGSFKAVQEFGKTFSFDLSAEANVKAGAQAFVGPKLSVALADMAGIATGLYPWGEVGIDARAAKLEEEEGVFCQLWYAFGIEVPLKGQYGFPFMDKKEVDFAVYKKEFIRRNRDCAPALLKKLLGGTLEAPARAGSNGKPAVDKETTGEMVEGQKSEELDAAAETAANAVKKGRAALKRGNTVAGRAGNAVAGKTGKAVPARTRARGNTVKNAVAGRRQAKVTPKRRGKANSIAMAIQEGGSEDKDFETTEDVDEQWDHFRHTAMSCDSSLCNDNGVCMFGQCSCDDGWTGSDCSEVKPEEIVKPCSSECTTLEEGDVDFCKHLVGSTVCAARANVRELDSIAIERANQSSETFQCFFKQLAVHCDIVLPSCNDDKTVDAMALEDCTDVHDECDVDDHKMTHQRSIKRCRAYAIHGMETRVMVEKAKLVSAGRSAGRAMRVQSTADTSRIGRCEVAKTEDLIACPHLANKQVFVYSMFGNVLAANTYIEQQHRKSAEIGDCLLSEIAAICHSFLPVCNNANDAPTGICTDSCEQIFAPCKDTAGAATFCNNTKIGFAAASDDCHRLTLDEIKGQAATAVLERTAKDIINRKNAPHRHAKSREWLWIAVPAAGVAAVALLATAAVLLRARRQETPASEIALVSVA